MAFYLYARFHIDRESWPDFSDTLGWQQIKLLRSRNSSTDKLSYSAQNLAIKTAFHDHKINLKSWTHLGRKAGCQLGEALDVPDAQIRRLGHWDTSRMTKHYSSGIARQAARMLAGHGSEAGNYYLSRESVIPSESLRRQIFPLIEESLEYIYNLSDDDQDLAAQAFLKVLDWFRTIILQDAVELRRLYPNSPLWSHAPFNTPGFHAFEMRLEREKKTSDLPKALQLKQLMPEVANQIQGIKEFMSNEFEDVIRNQQQLEIITDRIENKISGITNRLISVEIFTEQLSSGEIKWITHLSNAGNCDKANDSSSQRINPDRSLLLTSNTAVVGPSNPDAIASPSDNIDEDQQIPEYEINNSLQTVEEMWEEWDQGLVNGSNETRSPSIRYLEEKYGTAWRLTDRKRKRFSRRKLFIQRLQLISKNLDLCEVAAARKLENWRRSEDISLDRLQKTLQANPHQWGQGDVKLSDW